MKLNINTASKDNLPATSTQRSIGTYGDDGAGPTLLCICGIHGNEPSGLQAFHRVLATLKEEEHEVKGNLVGLAGNLKALQKKVRFIHEDLNRIWSLARIKRVLDDSMSGNFQNAEDEEQADILHHLEEIFNQSKGPIYVMDLHTTSSVSQPFVTINDTIRNREFAENLPFLMVLGIEEFLDGTVLSYVNELGHIAIGVESGQHQDPNSIDWHELAIWLALAHSGCLQSELPHHIKEKVQERANTKKHIFEVRHRKELLKNEQFEMNPGYTNFDNVKKGQVIAKNVHGNIQVPEDGQILMPLYQKLGEDGFFIVRRIKPLWLGISKWLRSKGAHRLLPYLPGIRKYQGQGHELLVNTKIAKYYVIEFFHLLGFRKKTQMGRHILFSRRKYDFKAP